MLFLHNLKTLNSKYSATPKPTLNPVEAAALNEVRMKATADNGTTGTEEPLALLYKLFF